MVFDFQNTQTWDTPYNLFEGYKCGVFLLVNSRLICKRYKTNEQIIITLKWNEYVHI